MTKLGSSELSRPAGGPHVPLGVVPGEPEVGEKSLGGRAPRGEVHPLGRPSRVARLEMGATLVVVVAIGASGAQKRDAHQIADLLRLYVVARLLAASRAWLRHARAGGLPRGDHRAGAWPAGRRIGVRRRPPH